MALFKTPEEREEEARQRAEKERADAEWAQAQRERAAQLRADAAFASSPVGRARNAYARGDRLFQAELDVSALTGMSSSFGSSENEVTRQDLEPDLLGRIEDEGWHLEHTGFVFVETGSTSTDRIFQTGQGTVTRGVVTGVYVFRRVERR